MSIGSFFISKNLYKGTEKIEEEGTSMDRIASNDGGFSFWILSVYTGN